MAIDTSTQQQRDFEDLRGVRINDTPFWRAQLEQLDSLEDQATRLLAALKSAGSKNSAMLNEIGLFIQMSITAKLAWSMTETEPGDAAGFTVEDVSLEDRVSARRSLLDTLHTGRQTISRARLLASSVG